jgi:hypothetical protein
MQPNDPLTPRPSYRPVERPYVTRPVRPDVVAQPGQSPQPSQSQQPSAPYVAPPPQPYPVSSPQNPPVIPRQPGMQQPQPSYIQPPSTSPVATQDPLVHVTSSTPPLPAPEKTQRNWLIPVIAIIALAIIGVGALLFVTERSKNVPNSVFKQAIEATLMTKTTEAQTNIGGSITEINYNLSSPSSPTVSVNGDLNLNGLNFELDGFGTLRNTYVKYINLSSSQMNATDAVVLNKWVQLRTNGALAPGVNTKLAVFADPRAALVGDVVLANLSAATSETLTKSLLSSGVYTYTLGKVKTVMSSGQAYYEYPVSINLTALKQWNERVLGAMGVPQSDIQTALNNLGQQQATSGVFYISKTKERLVRFDLSTSQGTATTLYMSTSSSTLPTSEPAVSVSYKTFEPLQDLLEQQAAQIQSDAALDSERKADITELQQYIQSYYASSGNYPTLADLNNQVWVSVNMQGINPDVFKDPQGASMLLTATPARDVYSYSALGPNGAAGCNDATNMTGAIPCASYKLSATLSNGTVYQVVSGD